MLNKQSRTPDKVWSSSLGVEGGNNFIVKKNTVTKRHIEPRIWTDIGKEKWYIFSGLREIGSEGLDWMHLSQDWDQ